jgi:hypothetical protein
MKTLLSVLLLTVMLRVWWTEHDHLGMHYKAGSGILINVGGYGLLYVVNDSGGLITIKSKVINKMKWVEVNAEKS